MIRKLVFIHLSDIHFQHRLSGGDFDIDDDLRNEIEIDAARVKASLKKVDAILVTGDIAFSGKKEEYDTAQKWLELLCDKVNCDISNIWVVPGNHDIDRECFKKSALLVDIHRVFRQQTNINEIDLKLRQYFEDFSSKKAIFEPAQKYNEFAGKYGCQFHPSKPYCWESLFELNDGSYLQLRGLNSTIISDDKDDDKSNKLLLGSIQATLKRISGVEYMTLCHHPPQWLLDCDSIDPILTKRARVQLFGHKHNQTVNQIDDSIRITAGAIHPDRREGGWQPRYNFIEVWITKEHGVRYMNVYVYSRVWDGDTFVPELKNGNEYRDFKLKLPSWDGKKSHSIDINTTHILSDQESSNKASLSDAERVASAEVKVNPNRILAYRFLSLPFLKQYIIAEKLLIIEEDDKDLSERELFEAIFVRAAESSKLADLWDLVQDAHNDSKYIDNPFKIK